MLAASQADIRNGRCDSVLASPIVGGAGLNCQSLTAVVFMSPLLSAAVETQCKGMMSVDCGNCRSNCWFGINARHTTMEDYPMS